jgi:tetratricopeptide (TPR) repeat protein
MRKVVPVISLSLRLACVALPAASFAQTQQRYLDIPGLGRVPIPPPPGARALGPSREAPPADEPAPDIVETTPRPTGLDSLLARLAQAGSDEEAEAFVQAIGRIWARSGSPTADLLIARAAHAARAGDRRLALDLLDHIVTLEPLWPQALVARAEMRLALGDADGAERDLDAAIRLEPRRFDALGVLGALRERAGEPARALDAYRRALALHPRREDWRRAEERLEQEVTGRDI